MSSKTVFLSLSIALAACVPLSLYTAQLRERSAFVEVDRVAGRLPRGVAIRCQAALLAAAEAAPGVARFPAYLTRAQVDRLNLTVRGECADVASDLGLLRPDLGVHDSGGQDAARPGDQGRGRDQGQPGAGAGG